MLVSLGVARSYRLHLPPSLSTPAPLVIVLHGASGNAARVELRYHWDGIADRFGFAVVYPQGQNDQWNATLDPRGPNDVAFVGALVDDLVPRYRLNARRVFVAGMSNGGAMTYRLACSLSGRIAAIAPVEAWNPGCVPAQPVSVVAVHGLADHEVPISAAEQAVTAMRVLDHCPAVAHIRSNGGVIRTTWSPCVGGTLVEMYSVAGSGHEWPGSWPPLPDHNYPSNALDATGAIWKALERVR